MVLGLVVLALAVGGCIGGPENGQEAPQTAEEEDFCPQGETRTYTNPQTGERAEMHVDGIETRDGVRTCRWTMDMTAEDGEFRMIMYDGMDGDYLHWEWYKGDLLRGSYTIHGEQISMREYDEDGELIDEIRISG